MILLAMGQGKCYKESFKSLEADIQHANTLMAGLNRAHLFESGTSVMATAFKRGPTEAVNKKSSGICVHVRTLRKAGQLKEALQTSNQGGISANCNTYVCLLQECIKMRGLAEGRQVHAHIIQSRCKPNIFLLNTLINMYAKCGSVYEACEVFSKMPERDMFTWNIMMAGYAKHGCGKEAYEIYEQMIREGVMPNTVTFTCVLNACASLAALEKGREVHNDIIKAGIVPDIILETALADMYAKCGSMKDARQVFENMAKRNVVSWNAMISGYSQQGCGMEALELFEQMQQEGLKPNVSSWNAMIAGHAQHGHGREALAMYGEMIREGVMPDRVTFICVLKACASLAVLDKGKEVHANIIKAGIVPDIILETALVDMYAKCGGLKDARQVFDNMAARNVVTWNVMSAGYAQFGCDIEVLAMYEQMIREGVTPDNITFTCVLNACASLATLGKGREVHADIIKTGLPSSINLENALVDMYAKCGNHEDAHQVFDNMAERNVVSWNSIIAGYAQHGCGRKAVVTYEEMMRQGLTPDEITFTCILKACASLAALGKGKNVHADIVKAGFRSNIILETALADMYAKCGSMTDAHHVFDNMAQRNVISWNTIIAGYAQHGCGREAFEMYEHMIREGVMPDEVTFMWVLNACANLAALEKGKEVHAEIIKARLVPDLTLETTLADMYAKCGSMKDACQVFDNMAQRNVVTWNVIIAGYAQHGCAMEALRGFEKMQQEGLKPDSITFICLLSACSHVGLVDEGYHYFDSMSQEHGLTPTMEHFGCMVDLLSRAGQLDEAEIFISKMPIEPDAVVWRALLGACRIYGNLQVAERVAKSLLKCHPQDIIADRVQIEDDWVLRG